jgi:hypothetical protein
MLTWQESPEVQGRGGFGPGAAQGPKLPAHGSWGLTCVGEEGVWPSKVWKGFKTSIWPPDARGTRRAMCLVRSWEDVQDGSNLHYGTF